MRPIARSEVLDLGAYEAVREPFRARVLALKKARYVALGSNMTLLFENRDTALLQIQEMIRTERITSEKAILHEIETYNDLVPGDGELSATLFIEYEDRILRDRMLVALAGVEDKFYVEAGEERSRVVPDRLGADATRTTAVQYLKFPLGAGAAAAIRSGTGPVRVGVEHPAYSAVATLERATLLSLRDDLE